MPSLCAKCSSLLYEDALYCHRCGTRIGDRNFVFSVVPDRTHLQTEREAKVRVNIIGVKGKEKRFIQMTEGGGIRYIYVNPFADAFKDIKRKLIKLYFSDIDKKLKENRSKIAYTARVRLGSLSLYFTRVLDFKLEVLNESNFTTFHEYKLKHGLNLNNILFYLELRERGEQAQNLESINDQADEDLLCEIKCEPADENTAVPTREDIVDSTDMLLSSSRNEAALDHTSVSIENEERVANASPTQPLSNDQMRKSSSEADSETNNIEALEVSEVNDSRKIASSPEYSCTTNLPSDACNTKQAIPRNHHYSPWCEDSCDKSSYYTDFSERRKRRGFPAYTNLHQNRFRWSSDKYRGSDRSKQRSDCAKKNYPHKKNLIPPPPPKKTCLGLPVVSVNPQPHFAKYFDQMSYSDQFKECTTPKQVRTKEEESSSDSDSDTDLLKPSNVEALRKFAKTCLSSSSSEE